MATHCNPPAPRALQGPDVAPPPGPPGALPPVAATTLVTAPDAFYEPTTRRECDTATALARGLAEYLGGLTIEIQPGGRLHKFASAFFHKPEPEVDVQHPAVAIGGGQGSYDPARFSPTPIASFPGAGADGAAIGRLIKSAELAQTLTVEIVANDPKERIALAAMVERALMPVEWMYGFKLVLPHYHGLVAVYEPVAIELPEDADALSRRRRGVMTVRASVDVVNLIGLPGASPEFRLYEISDTVLLSAPR